MESITLIEERRSSPDAPVSWSMSVNAWFRQLTLTPEAPCDNADEAR